MDSSENINAHVSAWPRKLTSVMESHRQRFSKLNQKFRQRPLANPHQPPTMYPIILPQASRPQLRQQYPVKQQIQTHYSPTSRSNTPHIRNESLPFIPDQQYITLANLTKILHVLQAQEKTSTIDTVTDTSTSTTNSAKQRVQQHLQKTATRWWKPSRLSDSHSVPSMIHSSDTSTVLQHYSDDNNPSQRNLPLPSVISNSTRQLNIPLTNVLTSFISPVKTPSIPRTRQELLIMQARGIHIHSYDHRYRINQNNMNFQQQHLIRQT